MYQVKVIAATGHACYLHATGALCCFPENASQWKTAAGARRAAARFLAGNRALTGDRWELVTRLPD